MKWKALWVSGCLAQPILLTVWTGLHAENVHTLGELLESHSVSADVRSLGGHSGFCMEASVRNLTSDSIFVELEPGRRLDSDNPNVQDIVVVDRQRLALAPHGKGKSKLYAFCCQAVGGSPSQRDHFNIGKMGEPKLVNLCDHLSGTTFKPGTIQNAIWVVTDAHQLSSVYAQGENYKMVLGLKKYLSGLTGQKMIPYSVEYIYPNNRFWEPVPNFLFFSDSYSLKKDGKVRIVFCDTTGKVIRELMPPTQRSRTDYSLDVQLFVNELKQGKYLLTVYLDAVRQKEWEIIL
jgi:hypothetical protein